MSRDLRSLFERELDRVPLPDRAAWRPREQASSASGAARVGLAAVGLALIIAAGIVGSQLYERRQPASDVLASPTSAPTDVPPPTQSPLGASAIPDARSGFLTPTAPALFSLWPETSDAPIATVEGRTPHVAPGGVRIVFVRGDRQQQVLLIDTARPTSVTTLFESKDEAITGLAWAADERAILVGVSSTEQRIGGREAGPAYSALREIPLDTLRPRELARITSGLVLVPIGRDRSGIVAAYETGPGGFAVAYVVVDPSGRVTTTRFSKSIFGLQADPKAQYVLGLVPDGSHVAVFPLSDPNAGSELRPQSGERIFSARWRPGTGELGVTVGAGQPARAELWGLDGSRRAIRSGATFSLVFRVDGSAALVIPGDGDGTLVALDGSARTAVIPGTRRAEMGVVFR